MVGKNWMSYFEDLSVSILCGYGAKPWRVFYMALYITFIYAVVYQVVGMPGVTGNWWDQFLASLYFSLSNFSTLGYGDIFYGDDQPWMRIFSSTEAWFGAMLIAYFVVVIGRKFLR